MQSSFQIGKYLISPLVRCAQGGRFSAAVSIRSGHASMTQDRLMRFTPWFPSAEDAERFAIGEALSYIRERSCTLTAAGGV